MSVKLFTLLLLCCTHIGNDMALSPWDLKEALYADSTHFEGNWVNDKKFFYRAANDDLKVYDTDTGQSKLLFSALEAAHFNAAALQLIADGQELLVRHYSSIGLVYSLLNLENSLPYVRLANISKFDLSHDTQQMFFTYARSNAIHLSRGKAQPIEVASASSFALNETIKSMLQSKSGSQLAVHSQDMTGVHTHKVFLYAGLGSLNGPYVREAETFYAKAGARKAIDYLRVFNLAAAQLAPQIVPAPTHIVGQEHHLGSYKWLNETHLLVVWANRRQNVATLQLCHLAKQTCREVKRFEEPKGWIEYDRLKPHCVAATSSCFLVYWIENWPQIWNLQLQTGQNLWPSQGNFTVTNIYGYNERTHKVYYAATLANKPQVLHLFANEQCLSCGLRDEQGVACEYMNAVFNYNYTHYVLQCRGPTLPYVHVFSTKPNAAPRSLESYSLERQLLAARQRPTVKYIKLPLADGSSGYGKLLLPPQLNASEQHALIVLVYGGPHAVKVTKQFEAGFGYYLATKRRAIHAVFDVRGTPLKGKRFQFSVNNHLGEFEVQDQLQMIKELQQLPYVDANRTAIWGHSFGGYMVVKMIEADNEQLIRCGAAGAPVINWALYNGRYVERYMGAPSNAERVAAYGRSNALHNIENFRTRDFLLMHGSADDNVHLEHSYLLAKQLQEANILFEQMIYVNRNHALTMLHKYKMMDRFFARCLNLTES